MAKIELPGGIIIEDQLSSEFTDAASVINKSFKYIFPFSGLILFGMLIWGGFDLLTSIGNPEKTKSGYQKIIWALVGFLIIFLSYWLIQILETIFGITVF